MAGRAAQSHLPLAMRILAVDDDPCFLDFCEGILGSSDVEFVRGGSAAEALASLDEAPADLVFLDLHLPGIDGASIARLIRGRPDGADVVIGIVTEASPGSGASRAMDDPATFYATKRSLIDALTRAWRPFSPHGSS